MIISDYVSTGLGAYLRYLLNGSRISVLFQFRDNYGQLDSNLVFWDTDLGKSCNLGSQGTFLHFVKTAAMQVRCAESSETLCFRSLINSD